MTALREMGQCVWGFVLVSFSVPFCFFFVPDRPSASECRNLDGLDPGVRAALLKQRRGPGIGEKLYVGSFYCLLAAVYAFLLNFVGAPVPITAVASIALSCVTYLALVMWLIGYGMSRSM